MDRTAADRALRFGGGAALLTTEGKIVWTARMRGMKRILVRTPVALLVIDDTGEPLYEIPADSNAWQSVIVSDDFTWLVTYDRAQTPRVQFFKLE